MLDINLLRKDDNKKIKEQILKKEPNFQVEKLILLDKQLREQKCELEDLLCSKNEISKLGKNVTDSQKQQAIEIGKKIKSLKPEVEEVEKAYQDLLLRCPNFVAQDVPSGNKESNALVQEWGKIPEFDFEPKNHLELNEKLEWFSFPDGAKIAGAQFPVYKNDGVKLMYALTRLMLQHNAQNGFTPVMPPVVVSRQALLKNGSLPKFQGDFYDIVDEKLSLTPTAEVCITNLHADKVYTQDQLPIRSCAWTSCFRREAGGYGSHERGLIRIHQFEKVEIYSVSHPEKSNDELNFMTSVAQDFLKKLGLPFRKMLLAAQDTSFVAHKTYDLELWLAGQKGFYEISSASNCQDFQARRAGIKFTNEKNKKEFVHTLNASSLSLPRLFVALMENYQQKDGTVKLPEILINEMDKLW